MLTAGGYAWQAPCLPQGPCQRSGLHSTVHAFLASVLVPRAGGYRLYWAVYVLRRSWLTPLYMALIEPFRRFVVYPSLFRRLYAAWCGRYVA